PERNVRKDDDWRAARELLDVLLQPLELFVAKRSESACLEVYDVDQADEMHTVLVEAVPSGTERSLSESLEVTLALVSEHVVLAGDIENRERQFRQHLLQRVELRRLREVRQVPGMEDESGRLRLGLDFRDRLPQGG